MQRLIDIRAVSAEKEEERRLQMLWLVSERRSRPLAMLLQVRMSKVRSTHLCDTRSNWRDSALPKLQCAGRRSETLYYVTSPISAVC